MVDQLQVTDPCVCVISASGQNVFFAELLDAISDTLAARGLRIERSIDRFPPWRDDVVYLFVPHEYLPLVEDGAHPNAAHLGRSVVLCTEQPGTQWFEEAAGVASRAAAAVDINPLGMRELRKRGIEADLMHLGYFAGWDTWRGHDDGTRPIDLTFMGGYTPRRSKVLAQCARLLVNRRIELHMTESALPHHEDSIHFLSGERRWALLRRSKLIVNIHRSEIGYLEWLRVVGAMLNGCVVLTEHSLGFEPLVPGEHFVSAGYNRLPFAIDALLTDHELMSEIQERAYRFLCDELPLLHTITPLVEAIEKVASKPVPPGLVPPVPVSPSPRKPRFPPTEFEQIRTQHSDSDLGRIKAAVKDLVLGQMDLRRQLTSLAAGRSGTLVDDQIEHRGPRDHPIRVSVLLTVYDYADVVGRAIASVAASDFENFELIVVDDCSKDASLAAIHAEVERYPWMTITVVARKRNQGLAEARNCAVAHACGELVFILDADNEIYPHALGRLVGALDKAPAASFAYGVIEQFGPEGPRDLMSWHGWDPVRLRYGNYIDAMAMIRRAALLEVGGYTRDVRLHGWEDFALWCAFASRGFDGLRVPEILARYRTGGYSMISTTNIDTTAAWSVLMEEHTFLRTY